MLWSTGIPIPAGRDDDDEEDGDDEAMCILFQAWGLNVAEASRLGFYFKAIVS
jgi:hypothetical protein